MIPDQKRQNAPTDNILSMTITPFKIIFFYFLHVLVDLESLQVLVN